MKDELQQILDEINEILSHMTKEERLAWFRKSQYAKPIDFLKEIDGTTYAVRSHFAENASESITEKVERLTTKPMNI